MNQDNKKTAHTFWIPTLAKIRPASLVFTLLATLITLSGCDGESLKGTPVVMSFAELRQPITLRGTQPIFKNGKIVIYKNYLLINEPDKGIHLIDNTTPENPVQLGFIPIAGNTDIVIKDDLLYANNYVDIVALDISDANDIKTHHRAENVLAPRYNPAAYGVSSDAGVIIAFVYES